MEIKYKGTVQGVEKLVSKLAKTDVGALNVKWVSWATIYAQRIAKQEAPVKEGHLRRSISVKIRPTSGKVYTDLPYAVYVHEGTGPYTIRAKNAKVLTDGKSFFGKVVKHPGIKANPFFERASEIADGPAKEKYVGMLKSFLDATIGG